MSLLDAILNGYPLRPDGLHGVGHWARVLDNGLRLAPLTGADPRVITLFALFHDSRRENDGFDPNHGSRGAELAQNIRGHHILLSELPDTSFDALVTACTLHTHARTHHNPTVATCFDADRLDLPRCGYVIDPARLCTDAARDPATVRWATDRSEANFVSESLALLRAL